MNRPRDRRHTAQSDERPGAARDADEKEEQEGAVKRRVKNKNADLGALKNKEAQTQMSRPLVQQQTDFFFPKDFDLILLDCEPFDRWPTGSIDCQALGVGWRPSFT